MIGRIAGVILHRASDHVLIDVHGVGYIVHLSESIAAGLPPVGQPLALYTDLLVREDRMQLLGFTSLIDKEWHRLLTSVQGVGAKVSLALLGSLGGDALGRALAMEDTTALRQAPGVGPKLAARIAMELKDKAPAVIALGGSLSVDAGMPAVTHPAPVVDGVAPVKPAAKAVKSGEGGEDPARMQGEALSALTNLGYAPAEAARAVAEATGIEPAASAAALIRAALRLLAPKG